MPQSKDKTTSKKKSRSKPSATRSSATDPLSLLTQVLAKETRTSPPKGKKSAPKAFTANTHNQSSSPLESLQATSENEVVLDLAAKDQLHEERLLLLQSFAHIVLAGGSPPSDSMRLIAESLDRYLEAEGKLTLDEAFGLHSRQGAGNPAKRYASKYDHFAALAEVARVRVTQPCSIEAAVLQVVEEFKSEYNVTLSEESLFRAYKTRPRGEKQAVGRAFEHVARQLYRGPHKAEP